MRMKVLFLIESLAGGGAEKVLSTLVQNIDKRKFDVTVCVISGGGKYENEVKSCCKYKALLPLSVTPLGKVLYYVKHHLIYKWLPMWAVYMLFVPKGYDAEVAFVEGFATKLLSASSNKKKIAWVHTDLKNNHWTKSIYRDIDEETEAYSRFNAVACVSVTAREGFIHEFGNLGTPIITMYNPIDSNLIRSMAKEAINDDCHDVPLLVTTGRLEMQKGYDRLLRIVKRLIDEGHKFNLWILGTGSQDKSLKLYAEKNGLADIVKFLGFHSNPYKYIVQGDLFVCSSRSEGYSTAVTEALILGVPVITTECSGMRELLDNGQYGIITDNDDEALYQGLNRLLENDSLLEHYKKMAIKRGDDFSMKNLMKPIEQLLMLK